MALSPERRGAGPHDETGSLIRAPSGSPTFAPGQDVADRYHVVGLLAEGGMGEVYEAIDRALHERVALKVVRAEIARDRRILERFRSEVQLARRVTHANVCRIYDLGHHGDVVFLSMELLTGQTLAERLRTGGRLRLAEALPILAQLAAGLDAAHRAGVVHGDLKPSNVMLVGDGARAVITDFGLARGHSPSPMLPEGLAGSPAYMAPEQLGVGEVGAAADTYALGVMMYQMATGVLPFRGATPAATAALRLTATARPPRELAPDVDPRWEAAIVRCLARDPAQRFAGALGVVEALRPRRRRWPWVAATVALLVTALLLDPRAPPRPRASLPRDPQAARLYAEGLGQLRHSEARAAIDLLDRAVIIDPGDPLVHAALADAWWFLGFEVEARASARAGLELSEAASLSPEDKMVVEARYFETAGELGKAADLYRRLQAHDLDDPEPGFALLRVFWRRGDIDGIRMTLDGLRRLPNTTDDPRFDVGLKNLAICEGDRPAALAAAARLVARGTPALVLVGRDTEALVRWALGDLAGAERALGEVTALAEQVGDRNALAGSRWLAALVQLDRGALAGAQRDLEAIDVATPDGRGSFANKLDGLGMVALARGDLDAAEAAFRRALDAATEDEGGKPAAARERSSLGRVAYERGELARARELFAAALPAFRDVGQTSAVAYTLTAQAAVRAAGSDVAGARADLDEALGVWETRGAILEAARCRVALARLELDDDHPRAAVGQVLGALAALAGIPDERAQALAVLAVALARVGQRQAAVEVGGAAQAAAAGSESLLVRLDVALSVARARGDAAAAATVRELATRAGLERRALEARLLLAELDGGRGAGLLARDARARGLTGVAARAEGLGR